MFLHCVISSLPFKFLGIMLGDSPRKAKLWKSIVDVLRIRLSIWRGRNFSIGGRVVLINSVLSVLSIFMLSFTRLLRLSLRRLLKFRLIFCGEVILIISISIG